MSNLIKKYLPVAVLLIIALLIRLYAALKVPLIGDEEAKIYFTRQISFNLKELKIPVGDETIMRPLLSTYLIKFGYSVFNGSKSGVRLLFVLFSILSLFFFYKLTEELLNKKEALVALIFLTFCQLHIGLSRLILEDSLLLCFCILSIYFFFKTIHSGRIKWVYLTGVTIGLGYENIELILLLPPVFLIFLLVNKKYRFWLKCKHTYISLLLMFILMLPHLLWSINHSFVNYNNKMVAEFGLSLRSFYLYFAEILAWIAERLDFFIYDVIEESVCLKSADGRLRFLSSFSNELPFIHWVLGILIFSAFFFSLQRKNRENELVRFSLIMFSFIFIATTIIAGGATLFDDHEWASMTIYPGIILCSHMLVKLSEKYRGVNFLMIGLFIYLIIRALYFINIPENQFALPKNELCRFYLERANIYFKDGNKSQAIARCKWVIKKNPDAKILIEAKKLITLMNQKDEI